MCSALVLVHGLPNEAGIFMFSALVLVHGLKIEVF